MFVHRDMLYAIIAVSFYFPQKSYCIHTVSVTNISDRQQTFFSHKLPVHIILATRTLFMQIEAAHDSDEYDRLVASHGSYFADMGISRIMSSTLQDRHVVVKSILQHIILYR